MVGMRRWPRHWRERMLNPISAMLSQLACLGVKWMSSLSAMRLASCGGKTSYSAAFLWVLRLSMTKVMVSASGKYLSTRSRMNKAQSFLVWRSVTLT